MGEAITSKMTERVAILIADRLNNWLRPPANVPHFLATGQALVLARDIILEMREPTEVMTRAAWDAEGTPAGDDEEYAKIWQAMVDAALKEQE